MAHGITTHIDAAWLTLFSTVSLRQSPGIRSKPQKVHCPEPLLPALCGSPLSAWKASF